MPKVQTKLLLDMPADLALDLSALSEAHYGAPRVRLIREALKKFIELQVAEDHLLRQRFAEAKARLGKSSSETIRLVGVSPRAKQ